MQHAHNDHPCQAGPHPMGFVFPFLVFPLAIGLMCKFGRRHMGMHMQHRAQWQNGVPPMFAEMHRRAHAAEAAAQAGAEPPQV